MGWIGWESNYLSVRLPRVLHILSTQFQWTQISERDFSPETVYAMVLANSTKWVTSQLFGCEKTRFGSLGRRYLHHLTFITKLLLD